jgi:Na+/melibiose symporter-like transporter
MQMLGQEASQRLPVRRHPHRLDYIGAALLVAASGSMAFALGDKSAEARTVLGLLTLSMLLWAMFVRRLGRADEPFIPLSVLRNATARNETLCGSFALGAFMGLNFLMPIYFERALGMPADRAGLALIPLMIGTVIGATLSGRMMGRLQQYKAPALVGVGLAFTASLLLTSRAGQLSLAPLDLLLCCISIGVGAILPVSTVCVQNAVETRHLGSATSEMLFVRQISSALVVALLGSVVMGGGALLSEPSQLAPHALDDLAASFRGVFAATSVCFALSLLFLLLVEEKPLRSTPGAG